MDDHDWLATRFEEHRNHLRAVAYRILGSFSDADDAVQEAWVRLSRSDTAEVENLKGWLTTVVARVCLNVLRSREARREEPLGVHVRSAASSHEVRGAEAVAGQALQFSRLAGPGASSRPALVNGAVGQVSFRDGKLFSVLGFTVVAGRIVAIDILADADRLAQLELVDLD